MHIISLYAFEGPNRYHPSPTVAARIAARHDPRVIVTTQIKEAAQRIGVVIGALYAEFQPAQGSGVLEVHFLTPTPVLGAALLRYVLAAILAETNANPSWDADQLLFDLQQQRRAQALPINTLQLMAEAKSRQIPCFQRADGALQLGYGHRGVAVPIIRPHAVDLITPDAIGIQDRHDRPAQALDLDWSRLATIPLLVVSGPDDQAAQMAHALHATESYRSATLIVHASFAQIRAALAEPSTTALLVALASSNLAEHGLAFDSCDACVILGLADGAGDAAERLQLAGLPLLVTQPSGTASLNSHVPALASLVQYARCRVQWFREEPNDDHMGSPAQAHTGL